MSQKKQITYQENSNHLNIKYKKLVNMFFFPLYFAFYKIRVFQCFSFPRKLYLIPFYIKCSTIILLMNFNYWFLLLKRKKKRYLLRSWLILNKITLYSTIWLSLKFVTNNLSLNFVETRVLFFIFFISQFIWVDISNICLRDVNYLSEIEHMILTSITSITF